MGKIARRGQPASPFLCRVCLLDPLRDCAAAIPSRPAILRISCYSSKSVAHLARAFHQINMSSITSAPIGTSCEACGQEVPAGAHRCPACGQAVAPRYGRLTLFVVVVLIMAGFALYPVFCQAASQDRGVAGAKMVRPRGGGHARQAILRPRPTSIAMRSVTTARTISIGCGWRKRCWVPIA